MAFKKDDAGNELVGVMHLFDGFGTLFLGKLGIAPIFEQPIVDPVLVDRTKFEEQSLVKPLDDLLVAFQCPLSWFLRGIF